MAHSVSVCACARERMSERVRSSRAVRVLACVRVRVRVRQVAGMADFVAGFCSRAAQV